MSAERDPETDQELPVQNQHPVIQELIITEEQARQRPGHEHVVVAMGGSLAIGRKKYGTGLQPFNGRDPLLDLEEELRDALVYVRQCRYERDNPPLPVHRTEAGYPRCATCDGGGCPDCTDPA